MGMFGNSRQVPDLNCTVLATCGEAGTVRLDVNAEDGTDAVRPAVAQPEWEIEVHLG